MIKYKVKPTCYYYCSFSLYVKREEIGRDYQKMYKYIELIMAPIETAITESITERITESIEQIEDSLMSLREDEHEIYLCVVKSEIESFFNDLSNSFNNSFSNYLTNSFSNDLNNDFIHEPKLDIYKDDTCVVCIENKPNILFCNCGHLVVCEKCYHNLENTNYHKCPKCRKLNITVRRIL